MRGALVLRSRLLLRFCSLSCFFSFFFFFPFPSVFLTSSFFFFRFFCTDHICIHFAHFFSLSFCLMLLTGMVLTMAETSLVGDAYACSDVYSSSSAEPSIRNSMPIVADVVVEQGAHYLVRGVFSCCSRLGHNRGTFCRGFVEC